MREIFLFLNKTLFIFEKTKNICFYIMGGLVKSRQTRCSYENVTSITLKLPKSIYLVKNLVKLNKRNINVALEALKLFTKNLKYLKLK